jgi:hypothetical protein
MSACFPAGADAARKLPIVLSIPEEQELALLSILQEYGLGGLQPDQLYLLLQPRCPGYCWDDSQKRFVKVRVPLLPMLAIC